MDAARVPTARQAADIVAVALMVARAAAVDTAAAGALIAGRAAVVDIVVVEAVDITVAGVVADIVAVAVVAAGLVVAGAAGLIPLLIPPAGAAAASTYASQASRRRAYPMGASFVCRQSRTLPSLVRLTNALACLVCLGQVNATTRRIPETSGTLMLSIISKMHSRRVDHLGPAQATSWGWRKWNGVAFW